MDDLLYTCCVCNGPLSFLGSLGDRVHFRCRDCGLDQSWEIELLNLELEQSEELSQ